MNATAALDRQALIDRLDELRNEGAISATEHAELLEHFDSMQRDLREEMARLEPEYSRRLRDDGQPAADHWLTEVAEALGRHYGHATRRLTERLSVVTGSNPAY